MTTVGYGDKAPVTLGGRLVALVWMFASILLIAGFTASIASALTVRDSRASMHGPEDLPGLEVGTVPDSTSERVPRQPRIRRTLVRQSTEEALLRSSEDEVDAVVYDHPLLVYLVSEGRRRWRSALPSSRAPSGARTTHRAAAGEHVPRDAEPRRS